MWQDTDNIYVVNRLGAHERLNLNKITTRLESLINKEPKIDNVSADSVTCNIVSKFKNNISTSEIDEYTANYCASASIGNPYYAKLAARIAIDNHKKNTMRSFVDKMKLAYMNTNKCGGKDISSPLVRSEFIKYVEKHGDKLEAMIDYERDYLLDFFGFRTFQHIYAISIVQHDKSKKVIERPQDLFMRTAVEIHAGTLTKSATNQKYSDLLDKELSLIKDTYDSLSNKYYSHATPTYFNSGSVNNQLASCFLLDVADSQEGIMKLANDIACISKWGGGIGFSASSIRGNGALIKSTSGHSNGLISWLAIWRWVLCGFNQGGKRPGSGAVYLEMHHPDIMEFLRIRMPATDEFNMAKDLFPALWVCDIFMERVRNNAMWSLFDPVECGYDLSKYYGEEYTKLYIKLEEEKRYTKQLSARSIWEKVIESNVLSGLPYICFKDTVNKYSNQRNIGVIKNSNLCVAGDTMVTIKKDGKIQKQNIKYLSETNGGKHHIWNGREWSLSQSKMTSQSEELLCITFRICHTYKGLTITEYRNLKCTHYHKFKVSMSEKRIFDNVKILNAIDLRVGDKLLPYETPVDCDDYVHYYKPIFNNNFYEYMNYHSEQNTMFNTAEVCSIESVEGMHPVYCFHETKRNMVIFNGIATMNCTEIMEYSSPDEYAVCVLGSLSLSICVHDSHSEEELKEEPRRMLNNEFPVNPVFDFKLLAKNAGDLVRNLNNVIDNNKYPVPETQRSNILHRPIGIGVQGLNDAYMKMRYSFDSPQAAELNKLIFETIDYATASMSTKLAREKYESYKSICREQGYVEIEYISRENTKKDINEIKKEDTLNRENANTKLHQSIRYDSVQDIPKTAGAYHSMLWELGESKGAPLFNGRFQWEEYGAKVSDMYDWETLRAHIKTFGLRNSLRTAVMPTASTSQLLGNNECIEPITSNIYKRRTVAGQFIIINKYLINDLYHLGIWDADIKNYLLLYEGSVQNMELPQRLKDLYKTSWEIDQTILVQQAIDRQPFIDQGQSLNLYLEDISPAKFNKLMSQAWRGGLKTGKYYLHTRPSVLPQKFTIDPAKQKEIEQKLASQNSTFLDRPKDECLLCGS